MEVKGLSMMKKGLTIPITASTLKKEQIIEHGIRMITFLNMHKTYM
jgi:hypothetical protein